MDAQKLQLKLFALADSAAGIDRDAFVVIFHRWIKERTLPELLIDVASYQHVPQGPSVALIGHGSDYFIDDGDGRLGLLHSRKRCGFGPSERLDDLARRTLHTAALLEREPTMAGKLRFATNELVFRVNDRLAAPNTDATLASLRPDLEAWAKRLFDGRFVLARIGGPKELFTVRITSPASSPLEALIERASGPPAADASMKR